MIIGLFGFDFISSNKGCEALTYTFLSMMERICGEKKLYVYNFTYNKTLGMIPEQFPVGTGFPSKLCWNCRFSCTVTKASGCKCIYCNSNGTSKTGYYGKSAFAKSSDSCDGI